MNEDSPILADLRAAYATGNLVVFVGADVSSAAGLPTWSRLTEQMAERLRTGQTTAAAVAEVEHLIQSGRLIDALSAAKDALGGHELDIAIEKAVEGQEPPAVVKEIAALGPRLRAVLTTNMDRFLERAFGGEWEAFASPPGSLAQRRAFILKLHGTRGDRGTWVVTREQYDRATFGRPELRGMFEALFRVCPMLFVGCRLDDDDLDQTFSAVRALSGAQPPMHFAIVPEPVAPFQRRMLASSGLRLITYVNADGKNGEVAEILRAVGGKPGPNT